MKQKPLNNNLIIEMIEKIENSENSKEVKRYINEVVARCADLCKIGESVRVLNEFRLMLDNLRQEFKL